MNYETRAERIAKRNEAIATEYRCGATAEDIAVRFGLSATTVFYITSKLGIKRPPQFDGRRRSAPSKAKKRERDAKICAEYLSGKSLESVGTEFGITRERVRQILILEGHEERHNGFLGVRRIRARERQTEKISKHEQRLARKRVNAEKRVKVRELYNEGLTYEKISELIGFSTAWVQSAVWATGGPSRYASAQKPKQFVTQAQRQKIADRYRAGEAVSAIAQAFGISIGYTVTIANKLGAYRNRSAA